MVMGLDVLIERDLPQTDVRNLRQQNINIQMS